MSRRKGGMPSILSISYSDNLLKTRQMMLEQRGFNVQSAKHLDEALALCAKQHFRLLIVDDSIPLWDKEYMCARLKMQSGAAVLVLLRRNESTIDCADYNLEGGDPLTFMELVTQIMRPKGTSA
jgi:DNA-binding response OmpR family regulator